MESLNTSLYLQGRLINVTWDSCVPRVHAFAAMHCPAFTSWVRYMDSTKNPDPLHPVLWVNSIHIQSVDMFGSQVGFVKFRADVKRWNEKEKRLVDVPGITFLRGGSVAILTILTVVDSMYGYKDHVVLTCQPRVPVGDPNLLELPAGMLDNETRNFKGKAADELREETGIEIKHEDLIDLTGFAYGDRHQGMYPSPGGCDEYIKLYCYRRFVTEQAIRSLSTFRGGVHEGEMISLRIVLLSDLWKSTCDAKALSAITLYREYCKEKGEPKPLPFDHSLENKFSQITHNNKYSQ